MTRGTPSAPATRVPVVFWSIPWPRAPTGRASCAFPSSPVRSLTGHLRFREDQLQSDQSQHRPSHQVLENITRTIGNTTSRSELLQKRHHKTLRRKRSMVRNKLQAPALKFTFVHLGWNQLSPSRVMFLAQNGVASSRSMAVEELPLILVIEDEYPVQGIVEEMLADGGFATDILSSGEEALTLFKGGLKNYKALITDVSLKGRLNGWEVASQIRKIDPGFPVVYVTGGFADRWASLGVPNSILLAKPFAPAQLITAVSQLLNSPPTAPA
jgi:CheY-like chemotaxis protein